MKDDLENRTGACALIISRRNFIGAAAATGVAGLFPPGFVPISGEGSATAGAQIVLPTTTEEVTPFKVHVPEAALNDLKIRLANTRWPERETVADWSQGVPLQKAWDPLESTCRHASLSIL